jgi:hypothetical protein
VYLDLGLGDCAVMAVGFTIRSTYTEAGQLKETSRHQNTRMLATILL